jgi:hypothetical protein
MSITNLTRYDFDATNGECDTGLSPISDGVWVKFEEAMEASSNSLQQLKREIRALINRFLVGVNTPTAGKYMEMSDFIKELRELSRD